VCMRVFSLCPDAALCIVCSLTDPTRARTRSNALWSRHFLVALVLAELQQAFLMAFNQRELLHVAVAGVDWVWHQLRRVVEDARFGMPLFDMY
jgi:hypothetical protein